MPHVEWIVKRRALLASMVGGSAGLAGCGAGEPDRGALEVPGDGEENGTGTVGKTDLDLPGGLTRSVRTSFGPRRRLVVSTVPGARPPNGTRITAGFVETATADAPARLWVGMTNVSNTTLTHRFGPTPPFSGYYGRRITWGQIGDDQLLLVPDDDRRYADFDLVIPDSPGNVTRETGQPTTTAPSGDVHDEPGDESGHGCWRARAYLAAPVRAPRVTLAPGESIAGEYAVLWNRSMAYCPPRRGGYLFEDARERIPLVISTWDPPLSAPAPPAFDRSVPALPGFDGTVWFHRVHEDATVYLEPETERVSLPQTVVTVTFQNFSVETLGVHTDDWGVFELVDGKWITVVDNRPDGGPTPIPPGGGHRLSVALSSATDDPETDVPFVGGVTPGVYAIRHGTIDGVDTNGRPPLRIERDSTGDVRIAYGAVVTVVEGDVDVDGFDG